MNRQILPVAFTITGVGEIHHFTITLPADTERVIGIQSGVTLLTNFLMNRQYTVGTLRLQATGIADQFYATAITIGTSPLENDLYGIRSNELNQRLIDWMQSPVLLARKQEPEFLSLGHCRTIYGSFIDEVGAAFNTDLIYTINVLLWLQLTD